MPECSPPPLSSEEKDNDVDVSSRPSSRRRDVLLRPSLSNVEGGVAAAAVGGGGRGRLNSLSSWSSKAAAASSTSMTMMKMSSSINESTSNVRSWFRAQSDSIRETSMRYIDASKEGIVSVGNNNRRQNSNAIHGSRCHHTAMDPLEGVIRLDRPLLLCQEIYNKIVGNHQTSLVSKEKVLELLRQDVAQHLKDHPNDDETAEDDEEDNPLLSAEELANSIATETSGNCNEVAEISSREVGDGTGRSFGDTSEKEEEEKQQPLVGFWHWDNTLRTHRMKLHVAKGADLALHVVLAIIVNQVRYERNAIAMTV